MLPQILRCDWTVSPFNSRKNPVLQDENRRAAHIPFDGTIFGKPDQFVQILRIDAVLFKELREQILRQRRVSVLRLNHGSKLPWTLKFISQIQLYRVLLGRHLPDLSECYRKGY